MLQDEIDVNPPTRDKVVTLSPPDPEIKSGKKENINVAFYNALGADKCVKLALTKSDGTTLTSNNFNTAYLSNAPMSTECRPIAKDAIVGWKVPLIGDIGTKDTPQINVISF